MLDDEGPRRPDEDEESLDVGSSWQPPRWVQHVTDRIGRVPRVAWLTAAAVAATAVVIHAGHGPATHSAAPVTPTPTSSTSTPGPADVGTAALSELAAAAGARQLPNYVRADGGPGECPLVAREGAPQQAVAAAVRRALPDFTVRDFGRTLDEFTALCTLRARAYDRAGTVLVVTIVAPPKHPQRVSFEQLTVAARTDGTIGVSAVTAVSYSGWTVTAGGFGPIADEPGSPTLMRLAEDPALRW